MSEKKSLDLSFIAVVLLMVLAFGLMIAFVTKNGENNTMSKELLEKELIIQQYKLKLEVQRNKIDSLTSIKW